MAYLGTADNAVYALRTSNGTVLWRQQVDGSVISQPFVSNGTIYASAFAGQNGPGYVYALRASDGRILWRYTFNGYPYVTSGADRSTLYLAAQDGIDALQASNGDVLWHYSISGAGDDNPVVADGIVYATSSSDSRPGTLYALDASDGKLLWRYQEGNFVSAQLVSNGILYLNSSDGTLAALRSSNGQQIWQRKIDTNLIQPLQLVDGVIYTTTTKITYSAAAQSSSPLQGVASIGSLLWNALQTAPARQVMPLKEGVSSVYAIRASDGAILWHFPLLSGQDSWTNWFIVEGGTVYAIRASDGAYMWSYPTSGGVDSAPVLAGTTLYVGAGNGMAYALQAGNGAVMWHYQTDVGI